MKDALYAAREDELGLRWKGVYLYTANLYTAATIVPAIKSDCTAGVYRRELE